MLSIAKSFAVTMAQAENFEPNKPPPYPQKQNKSLARCGLLNRPTSSGPVIHMKKLTEKWQGQPEGLEPVMWSKPDKQGELKKQGKACFYAYKFNTLIGKLF